MVVVDILLAANLVVLVVCAVRAPRSSRLSIEELVAAAHRPAPDLAALAVPVVEGNVVPFATREELQLRRARMAHPSSGVCPT